MHPRRSALARLLIVWLLLLAVSPLTAPFSTCGVGDLMPGGAVSGSMVKSKTADHQQDCLAFTVEDKTYIPASELVVRVRATSGAHLRDPIAAPLRI